MIDGIKTKVMDKWNAMSMKTKIIVAGVTAIIIISIIF